MDINKTEALKALDTWRELNDYNKVTKALFRDLDHKLAIENAFNELLSSLYLTGSELAVRIGVDRATIDRWRKAKTRPQAIQIVAIERLINGMETRPSVVPPRVTVGATLLDKRYDNLWLAIRQFRQEGKEPTTNQVSNVAAFIERATDEISFDLVIQLLSLEKE